MQLLQAWTNWNERTGLDIIDLTLNDDASRSEMLRCIHIGSLCVQENEADRPTMAQVATMLSSYSTTLREPSKPAFFMHSHLSTEGLPSRSEYDSRATESEVSKSISLQLSNTEVSISELHPR